MSNPQETRPAQTGEVRKGGPERVPDGKGFFGPSQPSGGVRPPREQVATAQQPAAPVQQTQK